MPQIFHLKHQKLLSVIA